MSRPNILAVMVDDHAQWALGCYGNTELHTPTLDYLASTGVRMANAFTTTPVCSPARASFWTGRWPSQHGIHDYLRDLDPDIEALPWLGEERTLAQLLQGAGYSTGLSGKWHLGRSFEPAPGFDFWFAQAMTRHEPTGFSSPWRHCPERRHGFSPHQVTDYAVDFLRARDRERPFFLFVGYFATHSPWSGHPERLVEQYRGCTFRDMPKDLMYPFGRLAGESLQPTRYQPREALAQYYAAVSEIDEQVGRLIDELDASGVRHQTLLVFTSDHGLNTGHHGVWGKGNGTRPLNMVEESIRVPLIFNQPGSLMGGQVRAEFMNHCDVFQTLVEAAGLEQPHLPPERSPYPGRSFLRLLHGGWYRDWPSAVFGEYGNLRMVRTARHKLVLRYPSGPSELFDLREDARETTNLYHDPEYQALAAELTSRIESYFATYEDPMKSGLNVAGLPRHNFNEAWRDDPA